MTRDGLSASVEFISSCFHSGGKRGFEETAADGGGGLALLWGDGSAVVLRKPRRRSGETVQWSMETIKKSLFSIEGVLRVFGLLVMGAVHRPDSLNAHDGNDITDDGPAGPFVCRPSRRAAADSTQGP